MHHVEHLTCRQKQVIELIAQGHSNKEIAVILSVSVHTVERHISRIYEKLGCGNRVEASILYNKWRMESDSQS